MSQQALHRLKALINLLSGVSLVTAVHSTFITHIHSADHEVVLHAIGGARPLYALVSLVPVSQIKPASKWPPEVPANPESSLAMHNLAVMRATM